MVSNQKYQFIVLGNNSTDQGNNFELFIQNYLIYQGFINIHSKRITGMQIDFTATHNLDNRHYFGELKGYNSGTTVDPGDVDKFLINWQIYSDENPIEKYLPIFITTSNFTWEQVELLNRSPRFKEVTLINGNELIDKLFTSRYFPAEDLIDKQIKDVVPFGLGIRNIIIFKGQLYWIQFLKDKYDKETFFSVFSKDGLYISHAESLEIIDLLKKKIEDFHYIDIDLKFDLLKILIENKEIKLIECALLLKINEETIKFTIDNLNRMENIININSKYAYLTLNTDSDALKQFFKIIYDNPNTGLLELFYLSPNFSDYITDQLINYLLNRFEIRSPSEEEMIFFKKVIRIFPNTLYTLFFQSNSRFHEMYQSMEKNTLLINQRQKRLIGELKVELWKSMMKDTFSQDKLIHKIKISLGLKDEWISGYYSVLKDGEKYLEIKTDQIIMLRNVKSEEHIRSGQLIYYTDPKNIINDFASWIKLGNYQKAIDEYQAILDNPNFKDQRSYILINLGVAYTGLHEYDLAISNYLQAIELKQNLKLLYFNLSRAWFLYHINFGNWKNPSFFDLECLFNSQFYREKMNSIEEKEIIKYKYDFNDLPEYPKRIEELLKKPDIVLHECKYNFIEGIIHLSNFNYFDAYYQYFYDSFKEIFNEIDQLNPNELYPEQWNHIANFYLHFNKYEKAFSAITKCFENLKDSSKMMMFWDTYAEIQFFLKHYSNAWDIYQNILEIPIDDIKVSAYYAETCWKAAKCADQLGITEKSIELRKNAMNYVKNHCLLSAQIRLEIEKYKQDKESKRT